MSALSAHGCARARCQGSPGDRGRREAWFSEASIWELGLKWRKGKIGLQPRRAFEQAQRDRFPPMRITIDAILLSSGLRQKHRDPFDPLLYVQARTNKCVLLSIDRTLATLDSRVLPPK